MTVNLNIDHDLFPDREPTTKAKVSELTSVEVVKIHDLGIRDGVQSFLLLELTPDETDRVQAIQNDEFFVSQVS